MAFSLDQHPTEASADPHLVFLGQGGEMGALTRAYDWAGSSLGPPEGWPQSLKTAVRLLLTSAHPMFIWWGPDLIQFYNDAYRQTMGPERHPSALGDRGRDCWAEIWPVIGPQIEFVMRGEGATWNEDQLIPVTRHGVLEEVWWTYGYSPIDAPSGVGGVLVVCRDVTQEHLAREALAAANAKLLSEAERQKLVAEELNHRIKNTLATVQALTVLTAKSATTVGEFRTALSGRIQAIANTQDLLLRGQAGRADVRVILEAELAPYLTGGQVTLDCEDIEIDPDAAVNLGLLVHELLTNAAKYGGLSTTDGSLRVTCTRDPNGGVLEWRETTERTISTGGAKGFGSLLIQRLSHALGGQAVTELRPDGLQARVTFALGDPAHDG